MADLAVPHRITPCQSSHALTRLAQPRRALRHAYLSALPDAPSRPEAIRRILTEALSAKGYLAEPDKPERAD